MQLTVTTPADTVTESVMVILPNAGSPKTLSLPASNPSFTATAPPTEPPDSVPPARASKPFTAPSVSKGTPSPTPSIPADSPPLKLNLDLAAVVAPNLASQIPVPPPPTPVTPSTEPAPQPVAPHQPASAQPPSIVVRYQPAVAIAKAAPRFPPEMRDLALSRKVIEVKVTIDKNGKVSKAEAIPQKAVHQFLVNSAVSAARLWRFQPALRDDRARARASRSYNLFLVIKHSVAPDFFFDGPLALRGISECP